MWCVFNIQKLLFKGIILFPTKAKSKHHHTSVRRCKFFKVFLYLLLSLILNEINKRYVWKILLFLFHKEIICGQRGCLVIYLDFYRKVWQNSNSSALSPNVRSLTNNLDVYHFILLSDGIISGMDEPHILKHSDGIYILNLRVCHKY